MISHIARGHYTLATLIEHTPLNSAILSSVHHGIKMMINQLHHPATACVTKLGICQGPNLQALNRRSKPRTLVLKPLC